MRSNCDACSAPWATTNSSASGPHTRTCSDAFMTIRAASTGWRRRCTFVTAPTRRPLPSMMPEAICTNPSALSDEPVPALKSAWSSRMRTAATTASTADPPLSRMARPAVRAEAIPSHDRSMVPSLFSLGFSSLAPPWTNRHVPPSCRIVIMCSFRFSRARWGGLGSQDRSDRTSADCGQRLRRGGVFIEEDDEKLVAVEFGQGDVDALFLVPGDQCFGAGSGQFVVQDRGHLTRGAAALVDVLADVDDVERARSTGAFSDDCLVAISRNAQHAPRSVGLHRCCRSTH